MKVTSKSHYAATLKGCKNDNFSLKNEILFDDDAVLTSTHNLVLCKNKKIMYTPVNTNFTKMYIILSF